MLLLFRGFDMHLDAITLEGLTVSPAITGLRQRNSRKCDGAPSTRQPVALAARVGTDVRTGRDGSLIAAIVCYRPIY